MYLVRVRPRVIYPLWGTFIEAGHYLEEGHKDGEKKANFVSGETDKETRLVSPVKDKGQRAPKRLCKPRGRFVTEEGSGRYKSGCFSSEGSTF